MLSEEKNVSSLRSLLPEVGSWRFSEAPNSYLPGTLFEYINGAAEIYLGYDFKELIVGQYKKKDGDCSLTLEIYDMGNEKNSFGIYSAERFPDNKFISIGNQGYLEEGTLNFIVGKYYVKLLCFECGQEADDILKLFSQEVANRVKDKGRLPLILNFFPKEGLVANSEKFILHNFLGYSFLDSGYAADYKLGELAFECFFIEGTDAEDAEKMLDAYLKTKNKPDIQGMTGGYHIKDRYYHHIYLARIKNYICGVMKIRDGFEETGKKYFLMLIDSIEKD